MPRRSRGVRGVLQLQMLDPPVAPPGELEDRARDRPCAREVEPGGVEQRPRTRDAAQGDGLRRRARSSQLAGVGVRPPDRPRRCPPAGARRWRPAGKVSCRRARGRPGRSSPRPAPLPGRAQSPVVESSAREATVDGGHGGTRCGSAAQGRADRCAPSATTAIELRTGNWPISKPSRQRTFTATIGSPSRPVPRAKDLIPPRSAEQVVDVVLVEEVVRGRVRSALELEARRGDEDQERSGLRAHRAVAALCRDPGVQLDHVAHCSAVTASDSLLRLCHLGLRATKLCIVLPRLQAVVGLSSRSLPVRVLPR